MTRALDLALAFALGLLLGGSVVGAQPRWTAQNALVMFLNASGVPVEASSTNPLPVRGY